MNLSSIRKNWFSFSGRVRRKRYWLFFLAYYPLICCFAVLDNFFSCEGFLFLPLVCVAVFSSYTVSVKRLHDVNKSAWMLLFHLLPVIGQIILLFFACKKGASGENRYGKDPLELKLKEVPAN